MRFDLLLVPFGASYSQMRAAALAAEQAGFNGLWTWDHLRDAHGGHGQVPETMTLLSALAEATSRIQIGSLVLNVKNRHPGLLANMAATLQEISSGRFLLGLGAGGSRSTPYAAEQEMLGLEVESNRVRGDRVAEAAQILRRLWGGGRQSFSGRYYRLRDAEGYARPAPAPPIVIAGFGPRMAAIAGTHGDGFNTQAGHPRLAELIAIARRGRKSSDGDAKTFEISVFASLGERWLTSTSRDRARLEQLGADRLIMLIEPPYALSDIRESGHMLASIMSPNPS